MFKNYTINQTTLPLDMEQFYTNYFTVYVFSYFISIGVSIRA
ncbi:hypothetical protein [Enterococcus faecalis]|nr:hypothetical protein B02_01392 [Enterococcus faecalis]VFU87274.1 hypothetical protein B01_01410 [Enterococcus faecalis]